MKVYEGVVAFLGKKGMTELLGQCQLILGFNELFHVVLQ